MNPKPTKNVALVAGIPTISSNGILYLLVGFVGTIHYQNVRIHAEDFKTCSLSAEQCCNNIVSILLVVEDPVPFVGKRC